MQRINWFPDPNITGTAKPVAGNNVRIEYQVVNNRNWLRATSTATGNNYAQYSLSGSQLPHAGSYHVHANVYAQKDEATFVVFVRVGGSYNAAFSVPVGDGQTVVVDGTFTIPSGCDQMLVRIGLNSKTVGMIGMMSDILIERADTYDTAIRGGASGPLHRRHHATRLTPRIGRVVPDDGDEPMHEPILDHHLVGRPVDTDHDRSERGWDEILGQCLCEHHRRHYLGEWYRPQCKPTCQLPDNHRQFQSDVNDVFRRVRQSDRHRDEHAHLHVGRVSGEQDSARQHQIFHRGQHAARLTLLGVVA